MPQHSYSAFTFEARAPRSNRKKTIEVFVSAGSFSDPYYTFTDKKGREIEAFEIDPSKKYRFKRSSEASTHPFYISDRGWNQEATKKIKIKGDGDYNNGIVGAEKFTLSIKKKHQKTFATSARLFFFCTSHPSMADEFIIDAGKRSLRQRISATSLKTSKLPITAEGTDHHHSTIRADDLPLMSGEPWMAETTAWDSAVSILNIRT